MPDQYRIIIDSEDRCSSKISHRHFTVARSPAKRLRKRERRATVVEESRGRSEKHKSGSRNEARKGFPRKRRDLARISSHGCLEGLELPVPCFRRSRSRVQVRRKKYIKKGPRSGEEAGTREKEASSDKVAKGTCKYM